MKSGRRKVITLNDSETLLGSVANELSAGLGSMFIVAKTPWYYPTSKHLSAKENYVFPIATALRMWNRILDSSDSVPTE